MKIRIFLMMMMIKKVNLTQKKCLKIFKALSRNAMKFHKVVLAQNSKFKVQSYPTGLLHYTVQKNIDSSISQKNLIDLKIIKRL